MYTKGIYFFYKLQLNFFLQFRKAAKKALEFHGRFSFIVSSQLPRNQVLLMKQGKEDTRHLAPLVSVTTLVQDDYHFRPQGALFLPPPIQDDHGYTTPCGRLRTRKMVVRQMGCFIWYYVFLFELRLRRVETAPVALRFYPSLAMHDTEIEVKRFAKSRAPVTRTLGISSSLGFSTFCTDTELVWILEGLVLLKYEHSQFRGHNKIYRCVCFLVQEVEDEIKERGRRINEQGVIAVYILYVTCWWMWNV